MDEGARRIAFNESVFREVNERIQQLGEQFESTEAEYVCECADLSCTERLELPSADYEHVRSRPDRFLLVPGHERPEVERVVEDHGHYLVVEKLAGADEVAVETDPRAG